MRKRRSAGDIPLSIDNSFQLGVWLRRRGGVAGWLGNLILALALLQPLDVGRWWRAKESVCVQEPATAAVIAPVIINVAVGEHQQTAASMLMGTPAMSPAVGRQIAALLATAEIRPLSAYVPFQADRQVESCPVILSL